MRKLYFKLFFLLLFYCTSSFSFELGKQLYIVKLPLAPDMNRQQLIEKAWQILLVRVSGHQDVLKQVAMPAFDVSQMLERTQDLGVSHGQHHYAMYFSQKQVNAYLKSKHQSIWSANRPVVLAWLIDTTNNRVLGAADDRLKLFKQYSVERGLPLILPMMDLSEQAEIDVKQMLALDMTSIRRYSQHYQPDLILLGRLVSAGSKWRVDWCLIDMNHHAQDWHVGVNSWQAQLRGVIDHISEQAALNAAVPTPSISDEHVRLTITGVHQLKDYAAILRMIDNLPMVGSSEAIQLGGDRLTLDVKVLGNQQALVKYLETNHHFSLSVGINEDQSTMLTYVWHPLEQ